MITTPAIAFLAKKHGFSAGVVISASHNPWRDNGIKVFGGNGYKLPDAVELGLESEIERVLEEQGTASREQGTGDELPLVNEAFRREYVQFLLQAVPGISLDNRRVVIDCASVGALPALWIQLLCAAAAAAQSKQLSVILKGASDLCRSSFESIGVDLKSSALALE